MGQLKAGQVDAFIARPNSQTPVILLYGPDEGLVSERADELARKSGVDLKDAFSLIRLNADDVAADPMRLADEAHTIGMFGGERLIRISGTTRRDLAKAVQPVLQQPPVDCWIIIEAGDLKKSSGLRKQIEKSDIGLALPCYQDNDAALNNLIKAEILDQGIRLDQQTQMLLRSHLGADRRASRNELQKLALYAHGKSEITAEDIRQIVGDASAYMADDIIDAVATGNLGGLEAALEKASEAKTGPDMIILATLRHFQLLHWARVQMDTKRQNPDNVFRSFRPPVHFSRKQATISAMGAWKNDNLLKAVDRLEKASLECRKNTELSATLASTTLLAIAIEARSLMQRR